MAPVILVPTWYDFWISVGLMSWSTITWNAAIAMQSLLAATVEYTKTRQQFGQPISKFQALQHRAATLFGEIELCKSVLIDVTVVPLLVDLCIPPFVVDPI